MDQEEREALEMTPEELLALEEQGEPAEVAREGPERIRRKDSSGVTFDHSERNVIIGPRFVREGPVEVSFQPSVRIRR